jgi:hypothetical protein
VSVVDLELLADVERIVSDALRADPDVVALVEQRVFTTWPHAQPNEAKKALVIVTRIGGGPAFPRPLALDAADLQLDAYGGRKHASWKLAATVCDALVKLVDTVHEHGVVHGVEITAMRYVPDPSFSPPRPRYVIDVSITTSPHRTSSVLTRSLVASGKE